MAAGSAASAPGWPRAGASRPRACGSAFVLASLALGLGVLVYVAAWLILPGEGEDGSGSAASSCWPRPAARCSGSRRWPAAGAAATVFGFGWVVVALAGAVLVGALAGWARLGPAWALLPVGALVLPSVALAVGGLRVEPSTPARDGRARARSPSCRASRCAAGSGC